MHEIPENRPRGRVVLQVPSGGVFRSFNFHVDLYVSSGPAPEGSIDVPNLVGLNKDEALRRLGELNLTGQELPALTDCRPGSQVVFQLPEAWKYDKEHQPKIARGGTVPFACSGDRYAAVPRMTPTPVIIRGELKVGEFSRSIGAPFAASVALAKPKSRTSARCRAGKRGS